MNLRTPVRHKTMEEVIAQCKRQKVPYVRGELVLLVGATGCGQATYMPHTGWFGGWAPSNSYPPRRLLFSSRVARHDGTPWMKQLRAFFHEEIKQ